LALVQLFTNSEIQDQAEYNRRQSIIIFLLADFLALYLIAGYPIINLFNHRKRRTARPSTWL